MKLTISQPIFDNSKKLTTVLLTVGAVISVLTVTCVLSGCQCTLQPPQPTAQNITQPTIVPCPCDGQYVFRLKL